MKHTCISLCCLGIAAALYVVQAETVNLPTSSGPETSLDSLWAGTGHLRTLTDTVASQINMSRFRDEEGYRLWAGGLAGFGKADVRNDHPSFDYSAGGYAIGYDYAQYKNRSGLLGGLAVSNMFGHQNIKEMPDHPDGAIPGDRYRQISFGADCYGAALLDVSPRSHLIFSLDAALGYMENKCKHRDEWNDMSKWKTDTFHIAFSTAWTYDVTESFGITPFTKISYIHAANKQEREEYGHHDWDDDDCEGHWDNRGKLDNMTLEVGLTLEHVLRFSANRSWRNALTGSYCPDIVRNNPHYTFDDSWQEGDTFYDSRYRGSGYPASRQAFKVGFSSRLSCSERLSVFASYLASLRESYTEHQAALGVSYAF